MPKYTSIWDISLVLDYYNSIETNKLQFKDLTKQTVMLFMIPGAHRKQASFTITVDNITVEDKKIVFLPNKTLKHSKIHTPFEPLYIKDTP